MPTIVNPYDGTTGFSTSHSVPITAVTAGNAVLLIFEDGGSASVTNVQTGATAMSAAYTANYPTFGVNFRWYIVTGLSGGQTTVSWTTSSSVAAWYRIYEVSGLSSTVDDSQTNSSAFSTDPTVSFTTTAANSLALGVFINSSSRTLTGVTAGYTVLPSSGSDFYFSAIDEDIGAAGAKTLAGTWGSGVGWQVSVAAFEAAASGGVSVAWFTA